VVVLPDQLLLPGDRAIVERRRHIRRDAQIPGRYALADHWDSGGKRRKFSCATIDISESAIALAAPVVGRPGKQVVAHIGPLGRIEGFIVRVLAGGFAMSIAANAQDRRRLIGTIERLQRHEAPQMHERRAHERFVPIIPYATLTLADGASRNCLVIDLSEAGARLSADIEPAVGSVLAVGTLVGRVVRGLRGGFAVKFVDAQSQDTVEAKVLLNDLTSVSWRFD
jgi:hypothetical protein